MDFREVVVITGRRSAGWAQAMVEEVVKGLRASGVNTTALDIDLLPRFLDTGAGARDSRLFVDSNRKIRLLWGRPMVSIRSIIPAASCRNWPGSDRPPA